MKIISLGKNCFCGWISDSVNRHFNEDEFTKKTNFLAFGIFSSNGNDTTPLKSCIQLFEKTLNQDYTWLETSMSEYRKPQNKDDKIQFINYYFNKDKTKPLFFRHFYDNPLENKDHFKIVKSSMDYIHNMSDIYLYGVFDNITEEDISDLKRLNGMTKTLNPQSRFIVLVDNKIDVYIPHIEIVKVNCDICKWKPQPKPYQLDEYTYNAISNAIGIKLNERIFR